MISVIIPNYNNARFLQGAIQSALAQTNTEYEIIVVDDGSTDNSKEIVAAFGDRVRYIYQENKGLGGARNTGILASNSEYIGLLDADDEWCPDYLQQMVALLEQNPHASVGYCMAQCMDEDGHDLPQVVGGPPVDPDRLYQKLICVNFIIPSTILFKRKTIVEAGCFDSGLRSCEDWDLWLRLLPREKIVGSDLRLVRYRIHGSSLSTNVKGMHHAAKTVVEKHFGLEAEASPWSAEKRRAFGGLYRYYLLTSIQRRSDWQNGRMYLRKALQIDPLLASDLDMFYELALGSQPSGYRGTAHCLALEQNAVQIKKLLEDVFSDPLASSIRSIRTLACGTAYYALGLLAYNTQQRTQSRRFLFQALRLRPNLLLDRRIVSTWMKSFLSPSIIQYLKRH